MVSVDTFVCDGQGAAAVRGHSRWYTQAGRQNRRTMALIDPATNTASSSQAACDAPAKSVNAMLRASVPAMACENCLARGAAGMAASRVGSAITRLKNASNGLWLG